MRTLLLLVFTVLSLCSNRASAQLPESLVAIFKYQRTSIPKYQVDSLFTIKEVTGERIVFNGADAFKISAYVTRPIEYRENRPFVLFNHSGQGGKNEFLQQALLLSSRGFVCMMIDGPWLCPDSKVKSFKDQGYEICRQQVMNARAAIDLAAQHFKVNQDQIFCVGHSFGCNAAAILSAVDQRIDYFVFMAGVPSTTKNISESQFPDLVQWRNENLAQYSAWLTKMKPLDAENFLPFKTAPCLIQIANKDEFISDAENDTFVRLVPVPKEVKIYDSGHAFNPLAESDRLDWILEMVSK